MSRCKRTLLAILLIEALLAGIWFYLARFGASEPGRVTSDFQESLGSTMGMVMGGFLGFGFLLYLMATKADRA